MSLYSLKNECHYTLYIMKVTAHTHSLYIYIEREYIIYHYILSIYTINMKFPDWKFNQPSFLLDDFINSLLNQIKGKRFTKILITKKSQSLLPLCKKDLKWFYPALNSDTLG